MIRIRGEEVFRSRRGIQLLATRYDRLPVRLLR
jgi:hypothetical protein